MEEGAKEKKGKKKCKWSKNETQGKESKRSRSSEESPKQQNWRGERKVGDKAQEARGKIKAEAGNGLSCYRKGKKNDSCDTQTACERKKQPANDFCFLRNRKLI